MLRRRGPGTEVVGQKLAEITAFYKYVIQRNVGKGNSIVFFKRDLNTIGTYRT